MSKKTTAAYVDLAEKHHVSLTIFKGKAYFHIRNNSNSRFVSLNHADMKSLVKQYPVMIKKLKELKKGDKKQTKKKRTSDKVNMDSSNDDSDDDSNSSALVSDEEDI